MYARWLIVDCSWVVANTTMIVDLIGMGKEDAPGEQVEGLML
jgi:hypothetical protein